MGENNSKLMPEDLSELSEQTAFSEKEIKEWYSGFQQDYPQGYLTISNFKRIYKKIFPRGNASLFAENVFRVFDHNNDNRIDFREFIIAMSISMRGTLEVRPVSSQPFIEQIAKDTKIRNMRSGFSLRMRGMRCIIFVRKNILSRLDSYRRAYGPTPRIRTFL